VRHSTKANHPNMLGCHRSGRLVARVPHFAGSRACLRFSKPLSCLPRAGWIPPHREPVVQALGVPGLTL
jgi:hypothetical protein